MCLTGDLGFVEDALSGVVFTKRLTYGSGAVHDG